MVMDQGPPWRKPVDFDSRIGEFKYHRRLHWGCDGDHKSALLAAARTGKNRIMIYGPRSDRTYIVEFETAA